MTHRPGAPSARYLKLKRSVVAVGMAFAAAGPASAFQIDTDNEDVQVRWDNTLRYNLAGRVQDQSSTITGSLNNNDGDRNFKKNSIVSNRLDVLSEFDFVYRKDSGFRVSAAAWGDDAYNHLDDHSAIGSNHLVNGVPATGLSDTTKRYNRGVSGEWLDAFVFTKLDVGGSPLYLKAGQHTVFWGESLFMNGVIHGIAYAQSPLDIAKGLSIPGAEAKELFRPLNNISANFQATDTLSLAAQYYLDWKPFRYPEAGSYLGFSDAVMGGGESIYTSAGLLTRLDDNTPKNSGDFGLSARWSPESLDGTVGLYYRKFSDKIPQTVVDARGVSIDTNTLSQVGQAGYRLTYGDKIDLFGLSLSKQVAGVSLGAELSYRRNMPLSSTTVLLANSDLISAANGTNAALNAALAAQVASLTATLMGPPYNLPYTAALATAQAQVATAVAPAQARLAPFASAQTTLAQGDTGAARGDTMHAVFNLIGQVAKTPLFDSLDWKAELTWSTWLKVTQHEDLFLGRSGYNGIDRVTKNAWTFAGTLEPKWYQVFPGVDLMLPLAYSTGLSGTSAVAQGGSKGAGSYSVGIAADIRNQYRFDLRYVGFFGKLDATDPTAVVANDPQAYLKDRGMLVLNFKTTF